MEADEVKSRTKVFYMERVCREDLQHRNEEVEYRVERVWLRIPKLTKICRKFALNLAHFRNIMILLIHKYKEKYRKYIVCERIWNTLLADRPRKFDDSKRKVLENVAKDPELEYLLQQAKIQRAKIGNTRAIQTCLRQIRKDFESYFKSLREYRKNPNKFTEKPRPPKPRKLRNISKFAVEFNKNSFKIVENKLVLRLRKDEHIRISLPFQGVIRSVRMVLYHGEIYFDLVYRVEPSCLKPLGNYTAGIDLGVNNFVTVVSDNPSIDSIIISGGMIKAFNQWFNKKLALYRSNLDKARNQIDEYKELKKEVPEQLMNQEKLWRRMIDKLCVHRKKWMDNIVHQISQHLARFLYFTGHCKVYIGKLTEAKRNCDLGRANNQNFHYIPFREFINKLKYKCKQYGIEVVEVDEYHTSSTCSLCKSKLSRVKRGLSICNSCKIAFNAECVGAANIGRVLITSLRKLCNPVKFRNIYKFVRFSLKVTLESLRRVGIEGSRLVWSKPTSKWFTSKLFELLQILSLDSRRLQVEDSG